MLKRYYCTNTCNRLNVNKGLVDCNSSITDAKYAFAENHKECSVIDWKTFGPKVLAMVAAKTSRTAYLEQLLKIADIATTAVTINAIALPEFF